tara:strand:- start:1636 stop:2076 length:441 start_codon:yes stop_codon:yes gene_type:complete
MTKEITELITCDRPVLQVGNKYEIDIYDLNSYESYSDEHERVMTGYITYEGGDIADYLMQQGKAYAKNRIDKQDERLGEYFCEVRNAKEDDNYSYFDLIFEVYSSKTLLYAWDSKRDDFVIEDRPSSKVHLGVFIIEYKEPNFISL